MLLRLTKRVAQSLCICEASCFSRRLQCIAVPYGAARRRTATQRNAPHPRCERTCTLRICRSAARQLYIGRRAISNSRLLPDVLVNHESYRWWTCFVNSRMFSQYRFRLSSRVNVASFLDVRLTVCSSVSLFTSHLYLISSHRS